VTPVVPSYDPATAWNRFWLANCHLFISHTACCISAFYGMAFQNVALNISFLAVRTCSDMQFYGLDFISHTELLLLNINAAGKFLGCGMLDDDI
jgi:hypothetical protein